ncbi:MAG: RNA polymerase sigma factor [Bacteroidaceae bacterium]|nr:RNA polymerase sigma factor [Bacteroidaceae bacterium]
MPSVTDIALVLQVVTIGSQRAFATLVERHQEPVRRFLRSLTNGDEALADDLAQETFIRAWQGLRSFRGSASFRTWVMRIAYHTFLDEVRKSKPTETLDSNQRIEPNATQTDNFMLRHDVQQALDSLSEIERTCITLQLIEGQSIADIATISGLPQNTVKSHLMRGKQHLTTYLRNHGYKD